MRVVRASDLERDVYLGHFRGSDIIASPYWDIGPAFFNPDSGTKVGKIKPFC